MITVLLASIQLYAADIAILDAPVNEIDKRNDYTNILLTAILKKTEPAYGPFTITYTDAYMHRDRLLSELIKGKSINVTAKATRPDWEESKLFTIRIPVDKGITEYRIFFIRKDDQARFTAVKNINELKAMTLGVGHAWSTNQVFKKLGFKTAAAADWEGLYKMLIAKRFDYFPRALSEVFIEYDDRKTNLPDLAIEQSLLLYFPLPKYYFVSPENPRLAKRIEEGFKLMIRDGSFDKLFLSYHKPLIERAQFKSRRLFRLPNPLLSPKTPLNVPEYWYDPYGK
jgi:hypothetical protein